MPAFIAQAIGRASLMSSNLPSSSNKVHHLANNIAQKPDTRLLHFGENLSYSLYDNKHVKVHWIDSVDTIYDIENLPPRLDVSPYNMIYVQGDMLRTSLLYHLQDKLARDVIFIVSDTRTSTSNKSIADRCIANVQGVRVDFRVDINDRYDTLGWDNGVSIYLLKKLE
jgi:hypothetical protein